MPSHRRGMGSPDYVTYRSHHRDILSLEKHLTRLELRINLLITRVTKLELPEEIERSAELPSSGAPGAKIDTPYTAQHIEDEF